MAIMATEAVPGPLAVPTTLLPAPPAKKRKSPLFKFSFELVLQDLSSRFVVNLPKSELTSMERIYFQCEQAHWFYEDFVRPSNPNLQGMKLRSFSWYLLKTASEVVPIIRKYISSNDGDLNDAFDSFMKYKLRVPVCGAILLNREWNKVLLVKGWKSPTWTFPKGKINQDEAELSCAIREVHEETGYDCSDILAQHSTNDNYLDASIKDGHRIRLYIAPGVEDSFPFKTLTRKEISKIDWLALDELPKKNMVGVREERTVAGQKFYHVAPFVKPLRDWIRANVASHPLRPQCGLVPFAPDSSNMYTAADQTLDTSVVDAGLETTYMTARQDPNLSAAQPQDDSQVLRSILGIPISASVSQTPPATTQTSSAPPSARAPPMVPDQSQALLNNLLASHPPTTQTTYAPAPNTGAFPPPPPAPTLGPSGYPGTSQASRHEQSQALLSLLSGSGLNQGASVLPPPPSAPPSVSATAAYPPHPPMFAPPPLASQAQALLGILTSQPATPPAPQMQPPPPFMPDQAQALLGLLSGPAPNASAPIPTLAPAPAPAPAPALAPALTSAPAPAPAPAPTRVPAAASPAHPSNQAQTLLGLLSPPGHAFPGVPPVPPPHQIPPQAHHAQTLMGMLSSGSAGSTGSGAVGSQLAPQAPQALPHQHQQQQQQQHQHHPVPPPHPSQQQTLLGLLHHQSAPAQGPPQGPPVAQQNPSNDLLSMLMGGGAQP